jgi:hypothetical protein
MTTIHPDDVRSILNAVNAYRAGRPIDADTILSHMGTRALPTAMHVLVSAMDAVDLADATADDATPETPDEFNWEAADEARKPEPES